MLSIAGKIKPIDILGGEVITKFTSFSDNKFDFFASSGLGSKRNRKLGNFDQGSFKITYTHVIVYDIIEHEHELNMITVLVIIRCYGCNRNVK